MRGLNEGNSVRLFVRLPPELREAAQRAAKLEGVEFSEWVRRIIERAASRVVAAQTGKRRKLARHRTGRIPSRT